MTRWTVAVLQEVLASVGLVGSNSGGVFRVVVFSPRLLVWGRVICHVDFGGRFRIKLRPRRGTGGGAGYGVVFAMVVVSTAAVWSADDGRLSFVLVVF